MSRHKVTVQFSHVSLTIFTSPHFADHLTPPGHPERVERFEVMQAVASEFRQAGRSGRIAAKRDRSGDRPHSRRRLPRLHQGDGGPCGGAGSGHVHLARHCSAAHLAAGAAVTAVDHVLDSDAGTRALALVRPPGHHAERNRRWASVSSTTLPSLPRHARARGLPACAVVDYDVHHGNGTQWSFYDDPSVLFISSHQYPYYPGTGAAGDIGTGAGAGFTVNLPLSAGATDADYELRLHEGGAAGARSSFGRS